MDAAVIDPIVSDVTAAIKQQDTENLYQEAEDHAATVVESEARLATFAQCHEFNVEGTARRILKYWKLRKNILEVKWNLPCTQRNAMPQLHDVMASGALALLPPDQSGCPVLCIDFTRAEYEPVENDWLRMLFYFLTVASENGMAQRIGVVIVHIVSSRCSYGCMASELLSAAPCKVKRIHLVLASNKNDTQLISEQPWSETWSSKIALHRRDEAIDNLRRFFVTPASLPVSIGGSWSYDSHTTWLATRRDEEEARRLNVIKPIRRSPPFNQLVPADLASMIEIIHELPPYEKDAFYLAQHHCPELVLNESPPERFIRFENGNHQAAAMRLAKYWQSRRDTCGDRAFLPMNLSGNGALTTGDAAAFNGGGFALLPCDGEGRSVLCLDKTTLARRNNASMESKLRCVFFALQVMMLNDVTQSLGLSILVIQDTDTHGAVPVWPESAIRDVGSFLEKAFPGFLAVTHVIFLPGPDGRRSLYEESIQLSMKRMGILGSRKIHFHVADGATDVQTKLSGHGFLPLDLPIVLGGEWNEVNKRAWLQEQGMTADQIELTAVKVPQNSDISGDNTPRNREMSKLEMDEIIAGMDYRDKSAYLEAGSAVVMSESPPEKFLRFTASDKVAAARKVCVYWKMRKFLFGERASLPMRDISGEGALDLIDIGVLEAKFGVLLPNDAESRSVFFFNIPELKSADVEPVARVIFYLYDLVSDNERTQQVGAIGIGIVRRDFGFVLPLHFREQFISYVFEGYPGYMSTLHFLVEGIPANSNGEGKWDSYYQHILKFCPHPKFHICKSKDDMCQVLEWHGLQRQNLPVSIGGLHPGNLTLQDAELFQLRGPLGLGRSIVSRNAMQQLRDAIDMIGLDEKAAYLEALQSAPMLVMLESDPLLFLIVESYNIWAAAKRLVAYWLYRKTLFGERAFLPMTIDGKGALPPDDVEYFKTAFVHFLPRDRFGREVVFLDTSKRPTMSRESRLRTMFYIGAIVSENPKTQTDGVVAGMLVDHLSFDRASRDSADMIDTALPLKYATMHICNGSATAGKRTFFMQIIPSMTKAFGESILQKVASERIMFHFAKGSRSELAQKLEEHGLLSTGLPESVGGAWTFRDDLKWIEHRKCCDDRKWLLLSGELQDYLSLIHDAPESPRAPSALISGNEVFQNQQAARARLDVDLQSEIELDEAPWEEARRRARQLFETESDPMYFLSKSKSIKFAARCLASYWARRKQLFGERAFLPLDQTGEGALNRKDLAVFCNGFVMLLPNDTHGRSVIFFDWERSLKCPSDCVRRCAFYVLATAMEDRSTRDHGIVLILGLGEHCLTSEKCSILEGLLDCLPLSLQVVLLCQFSKHAIAEGPGVECLPCPYKDVAVVHVAPTQDAFKEKLITLGLDESCLPKMLGGLFGYESFVLWQELRTRYEWDLPAGLTGRDAKAQHFDFSEVKPLADLPDEEKIERKRRMNVVHSRRKRDRERVEIEVLEEHCTDLKAAQRRLEQEGNRLESLLREAEKIVRPVDDPTAGKGRPKDGEVIQNAFGPDTALGSRQESVPATSYERLSTDTALRAKTTMGVHNLEMAPTMYMPSTQHWQLMLPHSAAASTEPHRSNFLGTFDQSQNFGQQTGLAPLHQDLIDGFLQQHQRLAHLSTAQPVGQAMGNVNDYATVGGNNARNTGLTQNASSMTTNGGGGGGIVSSGLAAAAASATAASYTDGSVAAEHNFGGQRLTDLQRLLLARILEEQQRR